MFCVEVNYEAAGESSEPAAGPGCGWDNAGGWQNVGWGMSNWTVPPPPPPSDIHVSPLSFRCSYCLCLVVCVFSSLHCCIAAVCFISLTLLLYAHMLLVVSNSDAVGSYRH